MTIRERIARWLFAGWCEALRDMFSDDIVAMRGEIYRLRLEVADLKKMSIADRNGFAASLLELRAQLSDTTRELQQLREKVNELQSREPAPNNIRRASGWREFADAATQASDPKRRTS